MHHARLRQGRDRHLYPKFICIVPHTMHIITWSRCGKSNKYLKQLWNFSSDELEQNFFPTTLDSNQALWMECYDKLSHPPDCDLQAFVYTGYIPIAVLKVKIWYIPPVSSMKSINDLIEPKVKVKQALEKQIKTILETTHPRMIWPL